MASELRVDTLKDSSGNNSVGMAYVSNGSAKMHATSELVGTHSNYDSFNVSSSSDDGVGQISHTLTSSMSLSTFNVCGATLSDALSFSGTFMLNDPDDNMTSSVVPLRVAETTNGTTADYTYVSCTAFGDLA